MRIAGPMRITIHHASTPIISGEVTVARSIIADLRRMRRLIPAVFARRSSPPERTCDDDRPLSLAMRWHDYVSDFAQARQRP
jgi:hypothetical protein